MGSRLSALVHQRGRGDAFGKVKGLIQGMIAKLEKEAGADAEGRIRQLSGDLLGADAEEKAWCDEQMSKTEAWCDEQMSETEDSQLLVLSRCARFGFAPRSSRRRAGNG